MKRSGPSNECISLAYAAAAINLQHRIGTSPLALRHVLILATISDNPNTLDPVARRIFQRAEQSFSCKKLKARGQQEPTLKITRDTATPMEAQHLNMVHIATICRIIKTAGGPKRPPPEVLKNLQRAQALMQRIKYASEFDRAVTALKAISRNYPRLKLLAQKLIGIVSISKQNNPQSMKAKRTILSIFTKIEALLSHEMEDNGIDVILRTVELLIKEKSNKYVTLQTLLRVVKNRITMVSGS